MDISKNIMHLEVTSSLYLLIFHRKQYQCGNSAYFWGSSNTIFTHSQCPYHFYITLVLADYTYQSACILHEYILKLQKATAVLSWLTAHESYFYMAHCMSETVKYVYCDTYLSVI